MPNIKIEVYTPRRFVCSVTAEEVILPVLDGGNYGILENHATVFTLLDTGLCRIKMNGKWTPIILFGGVAEIDRNQVRVVANNVEEFINMKLSLREAIKEVEKAIEKATLALLEAETSIARIDAVEELKIVNARSRGLTYLS